MELTAVKLYCEIHPCLNSLKFATNRKDRKRTNESCVKQRDSICSPPPPPSSLKRHIVPFSVNSYHHTHRQILLCLSLLLGSSLDNLEKLDTRG